MIKYSFVLPAYKARFFREALDSILAQTYKDFELIIVNDASPEDLDSIVKGYSDPRIRYYVNEKNIGGKDLVAQWNHCLEYATGEYVILASDDDIYYPLYLEKMDNLVCKHPNINVFRPRKMYVDGNGNITSVEGFLKELVTRLEFIYSWVNNWIGGGIPHYIFRRTALLEIGGFSNYPIAWFSDDSTVLRLSENGLVASDEVLFAFRMSGINICSSVHTKEVLLKKIKATEVFHKEILKIIINSTTNDAVSTFIKKQLLSWKINDFLFYSKILPNIFNTKFKVAISIFPLVSNLSFVDRRCLFKHYLFFLYRCIKKKILFWK